MKKYIRKIMFTALSAAFVVVSSCNTEDLDPTLAQEKEEGNAFQSAGDVEGLLKGMYNRFTSSGYYGRDFIITNEVRTPNVWANGRSGRFVTEATFQYNPGSTYMWDNAYAVIGVANILIGLDASTFDDSEYVMHMQGQAYAARALAHFDLLKTYGQQHVGGDLGIPYISEFKGENEVPSRNTISENVTAIMADLDTAFEMMSDDYFDSSKEFMSKYTAPALKSRVAVYFEDWAAARDAAEMVIDSGIYSIVPAGDYVASFDADGGNNSIFELAFSDVDNPGSDAIEFIYRGCTYGDISVTQDTYDNLYEGDDVRADIMGIEQCGEISLLRNLGKYPNRAANVIVIRYEEVVLNYAEALMELGEGDALMWLNMIPEARMGDTYAAATTENILEERREEFIFEGLYYWDLLRTEMDIVRTQADQPINIEYGSNVLAYPIPFAELDANSNIVQNPGYAD